MKRLIPYIIALIIIVPLIAGYFLIKTKSESYKQSAIQAIPLDACLIFENNDINDLINNLQIENKLISDLQYSGGFESLISGLAYFDSIREADRAVMIYFLTKA